MRVALLRFGDLTVKVIMGPEEIFALAGAAQVDSHVCVNRPKRDVDPNSCARGCFRSNMRLRAAEFTDYGLGAALN